MEPGSVDVGQALLIGRPKSVAGYRPGESGVSRRVRSCQAFYVQKYGAGMGLLNDARQIAKRDPAARSTLGVILMYSGFHALVYHKVSHFLFKHRLKALARWNSQFGRFMTGVEIHPGATIGNGLFIDHGMGIVIGETAVIGDNCTIYHNVTLGGRGHAKGEKRHPTIGNNVLIGAGAKILGAVEIGDDVSIGANAVIIHDVPNGATVVGVPGKIVKIDPAHVSSHAVELDHALDDDPLELEVRQLSNVLNDMQGQMAALRDEIKKLKEKEE